MDPNRFLNALEELPSSTVGNSADILAFLRNETVGWAL